MARKLTSMLLIMSIPSISLSSNVDDSHNSARHESEVHSDYSDGQNMIERKDHREPENEVDFQRNSNREKSEFLNHDVSYVSYASEKHTKCKKVL